VHPVTPGHFRSRAKGGGHTIPSNIAENPTLHSNFMALLFVEADLLLIKVLLCGNKDYRVFLFLWPWLWPADNFYMRTWPVFPGDIPDVQIWTSYVKAFKSYH